MTPKVAPRTANPIALAASKLSVGDSSRALRLEPRGVWRMKHGEEPCAPNCAFQDGSWLPVVFIGLPAASLAMTCLVAGGICGRSSFGVGARASLAPGGSVH
jgi:hypothetical protein